jgi:hypothetical protein
MKVPVTSWLKEYHENTTLCPADWQKKGHELLIMAKVHIPFIKTYWSETPQKKALQPHCHAYMMLMSFALENLIKGVLLISDHEECLIQYDGKKLFGKDGLLQSHDLMELLGRIEFESPKGEMVNFKVANKDTQELLQRLTRCAIWESRYPAPTKPCGLDASDIFGLGEGFIPVSMFKSGDVENSSRVFKYFDEILSKLIESKGRDK